MSFYVKCSKELKESFFQSMVLKEESDLHLQEVLLANLCMLILLRGNT